MDLTNNDRIRFFWKSAGDNISQEKTLEKITHLGIGAHQDDLEIMCGHGIYSCFGKDDRWFGGVTCTNGIGTLNEDQDFSETRFKEQEEAAKLGDYLVMAQFDYSSKDVKDLNNKVFHNDLLTFLESTRPSVVYTHNLFDKHDTHVAVALATIRALRCMNKANRPKQVYGCEVWRGLDWMVQEDKKGLDVHGFEDSVEKMIAVYKSQITENRRYDTAAVARMLANSTFFEPHYEGVSGHFSYAMDLNPLIENENLEAVDFASSYIDRFRNEIVQRITTLV